MSNSPENFDKLQQLLKLKRHEVPPPGYFNHFSTKVISRIESEQEKDASLTGAAWLKKFLMLLETNPIAAGVFGISVCGLLLSGIAYSQSQPPGVANNGSGVAIDVADNAVDAGGPSWAKATRVDTIAPSVNPMFSTNVPGALFGGMDRLAATPVSYSSAQ